MANVLVIGDTHIPAMHPDYLQFLKDMKRKHKCTRAVHIGDVIEHAAIKFHARRPEDPGAVDEYNAAKAGVAEMQKVFPEMDVIEGNHCARIRRIAGGAGIPDCYLKSYAQVWDTPKWNWVPNLEIDGVLYKHGRGNSRVNAAANYAIQIRKPVVFGHFHTQCGIVYHRFPYGETVWGMQVGSGINADHVAMQWGEFDDRAILACGIVKDGVPYIELMP